MSHEFDSGAFFQEGAWHRMGEVVQERLNTREFMQRAGMDWKVLESHMNTPAGDPLEGYKYLYREDTGKVLHVCASGYTVVQNENAFVWFDPFIQDQDIYLSAAVSLAGGKRIAVTAEFSNTPRPGSAGTLKLSVSKDDDVELKLVLYNSHNGSLKAGVKFTPVRVVCNNTLSMAVHGKGEVVSFKHTKNVNEYLNELRNTIDLAKRTFVEETVPSYTYLTTVGISNDELTAYLGKVFDTERPHKMRGYNKLVELFENGTGQELRGASGTLWGAYNAVTEFITSKPLDSQLFGSYNASNHKALQTALSFK